MIDRTVLDRTADAYAEVEAIAQEFQHGFELIDRIDRPGVTVFGSARVREGDQVYDSARQCGSLLAQEGFAVVTGGGPGVMEAANRGAREAGGMSVGLNIQLPHEQQGNGYTDLHMTFQHFYSRKVMLVRASEGFVIYPGGFGTLDEMFEALTLIQTGKVRHFPVVLVGRAFWDPLLDWIAGALTGPYVSAVDLDLVESLDRPEDAVGQVLACFRRECAHELGATRAVG